MEIEDSNKRQRREEENHFVPFPTPTPTRKRKRRKPVVAKVGFFYLKSLDASPISTTTNSPCNLFCLRSDHLYTVGRNKTCCNIVFHDSRVSNQHCQFFFDSFQRKIFVLDGFLLPFSSNLNEIRIKFQSLLDGRDRARARARALEVKPSLNGVFVNGSRLPQGSVMELFTGDEISLVCANEYDRSFTVKYGFVVERVVFTEEVSRVNGMMLNGCCMGLGGSVNYSLSDQRQNDIHKGKCVTLRSNQAHRDLRLCNSEEYEDLIARADFLLQRCRRIVQNVDHISYEQGCMGLNRVKIVFPGISTENNIFDNPLLDVVEIPSNGKSVSRSKTFCEQPQLCNLDGEQNLVDERISRMINVSSVELSKKTHLASEANPHTACVVIPDHTSPSKVSPSDPVQQNGNFSTKNVVGDDTCKISNHTEKNHSGVGDLSSKQDFQILKPSPGKKFCLNRLDSMDHHSSKQSMVVSLPELLHPVESLTRMFIATFTSDILWFLSYCGVPNNLPMTIACHNTEKCWSSSPNERVSMPHADFPNLVVVYPPFPDVIAFGKDRKRQGIACHHPKLLVLQREDSIRIVVTSANLVSKQWNDVTNTVWWQDFPRRKAPEYLSIFSHLIDGETFEGLKSDFAAQLAGFMASLVVDVPCQAHWILELTKYDFGGADGHLVASVPGAHMHSAPLLESMYYLSANHCAKQSIGMKFIGSVEASLVGLKHRFHTAADSNGAQLKTLATFFAKYQGNVFGMSEVVLRRNTNIPADANAVSVLICDPDEFPGGDYIQLGFLPRSIAKWVAPLCDAGLFSFSAYICPKELLAAALEGINSKVQLILHVLQGPNFSEISMFTGPEHVAAICSLVSSIQRCVGLWRLQELLGRFTWPELLETDFVYGSSSIGTSVNAQFLAAFSAAAGKKSLHCPDSEESDPEWGSWSASQELKHPSLRIIFPTIERVKDASCGIWPSRRLLCLSEKTWQRLRPVDIFHDAIPQPSCRVGHPMHVKVARRRFQSKTDASSFGWVYCGSHNFSPAAWGRPMFYSSKADGVTGTASSRGPRLHINNYELGIIFIVPPSNLSKISCQKRSNLDDIILPFVVPATKYRRCDRPATAQAMREALAELSELKKQIQVDSELVEEMMDEEMVDEEELLEVAEYVPEEKEEEKLYAEALWSQVDSSES